MKKLLLLLTFTLFLGCCGSKWVIVSDLSFLKPVYNVNKEDICRIDTIKTRYDTQFTVYYK